MLKKKKKGMVDDFLPIAMFVLIAAVMLFTSVNLNAAVNQKAEANSIARRYILKMETYGYLTDSALSGLASELNESGFYANSSGNAITAGNLDIGTTTRTDVGYGNDITLTFTVYTDNRFLMGDGDLFNSYFEKRIVPITVTYRSTSKE